MSCPDGARWLDADERAAWLALGRILLRIPAALDAQLQRDSGLTFYEYMVLAMLSEQEERLLRMSALAVLTNGSLSRLSHVVKRLEAQGLVRREPCPGDRRSTNAVLTDLGHERVVAAAPGHVEFVRSAFIDPLTRAQLRQLAAIGAAIGEPVGGE